MLMLILSLLGDEKGKGRRTLILNLAEPLSSNSSSNKVTSSKKRMGSDTKKKFKKEKTKQKQEKKNTLSTTPLPSFSPYWPLFFCP